MSKLDAVRQALVDWNTAQVADDANARVVARFNLLRELNKPDVREALLSVLGGQDAHLLALEEAQQKRCQNCGKEDSPGELWWPNGFDATGQETFVCQMCHEAGADAPPPLLDAGAQVPDEWNLGRSYGIVHMLVANRPQEALCGWEQVTVDGWNDVPANQRTYGNICCDCLRRAGALP